MIEFSFTLSDADAENLFDCIRNTKLRSELQASKADIRGDTELYNAYTADAAYLSDLKSKLTHKYVEGNSNAKSSY